MAAQGRADLLADFATPLSVLSIFEIMGVEARHGQAVAALGHRMVRRYLACCDEAMAQDAEQAAAEFARLIPKLAQAAPAESGLARLRAAEETGTISASDMTASAMLLLTAGHEALALALVNVVQLLLDRGIRQGITPGHVEEALRLAPPMQLFTRHALRDMTVAGVTLKAGDSVGLLLAAANLDPQRFAHPHAFNPARTPNPHLAFSAGVHFCLGAPLARLQLQTAIPLLFQRLPGLRLAAPAAMADLYHLHGPQQLAVIW
jgi:unspecific monooxygenase